ncbi:MAG: serine protease [Bacilli bacterium]|nr:serine protease [Bacilli bacterium]
MKKEVRYVLITCLFLLVIIVGIYFLFNKEDALDVDTYSVYIECLNEESISSGSGFVYKEIDDKSYIITNYHVIEDYNEIYVYNSDKEKIKASVLTKDEYTDIAILTIDDELNLNSVSIGDSDKLNIKDKIYAVGTNDISNISTVTSGIITDLDKEITIDTTHGMSEFSTIEMNALVESGNSGGPLLNSDGEVIGVVFVKDESVDDVAYALPINYVMDVVQKLENNEINRPSLGAILTNTTNIELMNEYEINQTDISGVILLEVYEGYDYGFQKGDIITKFNNKSINNVNELRKELYKFNKGDNVEIEYYRSDINYKIKVELK